jgi:cytoskeletal protein RodZ
LGKFGDKLRRERELRGVTLDEIAEATKIGTRSLRALEEERFDQLPGGIFNKGFVRAYARFLGLDEEQAVSDYVTAQSDQPEKADVMEKMAAQAEAARKNEAASLGEKAGNVNRYWVGAAILLLVSIGAGGGWKYYQKYSQQKAAAQSAEPTVVVPPQISIKTTPPPPSSLTPADTNAANPGTHPVAGQPASVPAATGSVSTSPATSTPSSTTTTPVAPVKATDNKSPQSAKGSLELQIHVSRATWLSVQAD